VETQAGCKDAELSTAGGLFELSLNVRRGGQLGAHRKLHLYFILRSHLHVGQ